eukprot:scaffold1314_cov393-Prasinococcus_capsulatus_cf.AAC.4
MCATHALHPLHTAGAAAADPTSDSLPRRSARAVYRPGCIAQQPCRRPVPKEARVGPSWRRGTCTCTRSARRREGAEWLASASEPLGHY